MIVKFLYEGIHKKITFSLLTIIQFTIAIICIYASIQFLSDINNLIENVNKQFGDNKYYKIDDEMVIEDIKGNDIEKTKKNLKILQDINSYFDNNEDIEFMSASSDAVFIRKEEAIPDTLVTYSAVNIDSNEYMRAQGIYLNKLFLEKMNYKLIEGNFENFKSVEDGPIPIIVGNIYKDKYSIGDRIETIIPDENGEYKKAQLKIVGILAENNYINLGGVSFDQQSLANAILIPFRKAYMMQNSENDKVKLIQRVELFSYMQGGYIIPKNDVSIDRINDYLFESGLKFQLKDFNKYIEEYKQESNDTIKPAIYVSSIVILFTVISVIIVMINTISKERKEYGINIMMGATIKDIRNRILGQVFLLLIISGIISTIILTNFTIFRFNIFDFILTFGVLIGVSVIISIIIIINLKKYSINDFVRRNE
ncbi:FtsX-like permease family protein [Clostridium isatidis]|uniref:FtsX-like permease family protein n=1 Tax=Clostridium isatidis TaxID=182773 RepID=UPI003AACCBCF